MKFSVTSNSGKVKGGTTLSDDKLRADMFMPAWLLTLGLLVTFFGLIALIVFVALRLSAVLIAAAVFCLLLGIGAILCWKNQTIQMLSDDSFVYSTFLGKKRIYRFDQIKGVKLGIDSMTLLVGEDKVYIDAYAILSGKLAKRIDQALGEEK